MSIRHLDQLLEPRSVVVVGASDRPGSVGATVWRNLRAGKFAGPIYGVNPKHASLDGVRLARRVADLPEPPDLAVLCTPPGTVPELVDQLGRLGTRAAVVMTAGLSPAQKQAALDAARPHVLRLLGPNCLGLLSPRIGLNASFAHTDALPGQIAFVSQSGALVTAVLDWARSRRIGFSHMVSLGERADVDFGDLLDHLASDAATRSILLYIESIESPRKFMSAARSAARNKPVIVVKAGRAGNGLQAAASHTGALAGSDVVIDAAIRRAGMLRVETLQDLFMAAETLAHFRGNPLRGLTLVTNGGGAGVMAADAAALAGVDLPALSEALRNRLDDVLPPTWSHGNPIDIIGDAPVVRYTETLRAVLDDRDAGTVLFMHAPTAIVRSEDIARACAPMAREAAGRLMSCWLGDAGVAEARRIFEDAGVAGYETPEQAVRAFAMLASYQRNQALLTETPTASEAAPPDSAAARSIVEAALDGGRAMLNEAEAKAVLKAYGIPIVPTVAVGASADAAAEAARSVGYPVALKILSPDISQSGQRRGRVRDHPRAGCTGARPRPAPARQDGWLPAGPRHAAPGRPGAAREQGDARAGDAQRLPARCRGLRQRVAALRARAETGSGACSRHAVARDGERSLSGLCRGDRDRARHRHRMRPRPGRIRAPPRHRRPANTVPLTLGHWVVYVAMASNVLAFGELRKAMLRTLPRGRSGERAA